jgi:hypothetical protein
MISAGDPERGVPKELTANMRRDKSPNDRADGAALSVADGGRILRRIRGGVGTGDE